nr:hypothetical protein [Lachnospiraceae bacterium]
PYLIRCGDKDYLYVQESQENDYRMLNIYSLQDGKLSEGKDFDRGFSGTCQLDPSDMELFSRTDLLSTRQIYRSYHVGEDGMPVENEKYEHIAGTDYGPLTLKQELKAELLENETSDKGEEYTLKKGDELFFFRTDDKTFVDFKMKDGKLIRIKDIDSNDWPRKINGVDIEEIFDGVVYAG